MNRYEARFAALFGPDYYTFCFWKGRVALYAILKALDLAETDEVIVPGYTCVVVPNAVRYAGAKPVYADIAPGQYNVDPKSVEKCITPRTRAVIAQHTYGIPAEIGSLESIVHKHRLTLIEDCAHVLIGSRYQRQLLGSFGKAAFFSFQWSKPYTTGLGGMIVTRDEELAKRLMKIQASFQEPPRLRRVQLRAQYSIYNRFFKPEVYWFSQNFLHALSKLGLFVGSSNGAELTGDRPADICWKMSAFQQRVGITQIEQLRENQAQRKLLTKCYSDALRQSGWPVPDDLNRNNVTLLRFPVQVANKHNILNESRRTRIELGSWFETPLHPLPLKQHRLINYELGCCPNAEWTARNVINLPIHSRVTKADASRVMHFLLSHAFPAH